MAKIIGIDLGTTNSVSYTHLMLVLNALKLNKLVLA